MKNIKLTAIVSLCVLLWVASATAQSPINEVLTAVEQNNNTLAQMRKLRDAQTLDARVGNSLENPEVEYSHLWGKPNSVGKSGELSVTQAFDFPTAYAHRNKLVKIRQQQYGYEYELRRQEVLLDAKITCIEISALKQELRYLRTVCDDTQSVLRLISERVAIGDANILDENRAKYESIGAKSALMLIEVELAAAQTKLINLNGGESITLGRWEPQVIELMKYDQMVGMYESESPEIQAMLSEKSAMERDVKLSRSQSLPKLSLGYRHEYATGEKFNGIIVGVSIPMFGNRYNVKRAKAQLALAEAQTTRVKTDIRTTLMELYAKAEILRATIDEYDENTPKDNSLGLLLVALEAGHISAVEYFAQRKPIYEVYISMTTAIRDYQMVCAQINMLEL